MRLLSRAVVLSAVAAARGYDPVLLIDADRQASSAEWLEERPIEGVTVVEAPSERTLARAMSRNEGGIGIVDTPPGDERLVQAAINSADAAGSPSLRDRTNAWPSMPCGQPATADRSYQAAPSSRSRRLDGP